MAPCQLRPLAFRSLDGARARALGTQGTDVPVEDAQDWQRGDDTYVALGLVLLAGNAGILWIQTRATLLRRGYRR
jgi:hypothetical protein